MKISIYVFSMFVFILLYTSILSSADIVKYDDLDETPQILKSTQPEYPEKARKSGFGGTALVEIIVDKSGTVTKATIKKSSGHISLDDASLEAAKKFEFSPGKKEGKAVKTQMVIPFKFKLKEKCKKKK